MREHRFARSIGQAIRWVVHILLTEVEHRYSSRLSYELLLLLRRKQRHILPSLAILRGRRNINP